MPTVVITPQQGGSAAAASPAARRLAARVWIGTAAVLVALAVVASLVLLRARTPRPLPRLSVRSQPAGATVLVNGRDSGVVTDGVVELPEAGPARLELSFRKPGYRDESRIVTLPLASADGVAVTLQRLDERLVALRTTPPGATLTLDGVALGASPLEAVIDPAGEHRLVASLEGYEPWELRIAKGERPRPLAIELRRSAPPGTVAVSSSYPLDVVFRGRILARNQVAPRVSVPGGRQLLTLVAPALFLRSELTVEVPSGGETTVAAPRAGRLNVRAMPDNCQVFVDGVFLDYPPILDRQIAAGRHVVVFRWPDGSQDQRVAEIEAASPAFVVGQKPKE